MDIFLQQLINGLVIGSGYALLALGLVLVFGILDILDFAHGEFFMLGAYFTYYFSTTLGLDYIFAGILSLVAVIILGCIVQLVILRPLMARDQAMTLLATFAAGILLLNLAEMIFGTTPQRIISPFSQPVDFGSITISQQRILVVALGIAIVTILSLTIKYTKMGKIIRATAQNKKAAALVGINIGKVTTLGFGLGCGLAAVAGILVGPLSNLYPMMGQLAGIKGFIIVVLGGLTSMPGAVIGGIFLGIVESLGAGYVSSEWKDLIGYGVLIVMLLVKPNGLFGVRGSGT